MRIHGYAALYSTAVVFAVTSIVVKLASNYVSWIFVSASRFAIGAALCILVLLVRYKSLRPARPGLIAARGVCGAVAMAMTYAAISLTGPGRATLLGNIYPLFVILIGAMFFGERLSLDALAAVVICATGTFFVVRDGSGASLTGDLLALGGAVIAGLAVNIVRIATRTDNPFMLYLGPCLFGLPLAAFAPLPSAPIDAVGVVFIVGAGLGGFLAQALMAYGYREVPAGSGSVVFFLETALTVALGALFAGEHFNLRFVLGLLLILGGLALNHARPFERRARLLSHFVRK
jgi:drug/metabolite transporter (DMT)-like permease